MLDGKMWDILREVRLICELSADLKVEFPLCSITGIGFGFSRRRIRLATLLASCRRSIPRRSRY